MRLDSCVGSSPAACGLWLCTRGLAQLSQSAMQQARLSAPSLWPWPRCRRPGAAQVCVQKQDHGLESGLDVDLIPLCRAALPEDGTLGTADPQPVYLEMDVLNTHRCVGGVRNW
jgi:hypothetical protein